MSQYEDEYYGDYEDNSSDYFEERYIPPTIFFRMRDITTRLIRIKDPSCLNYLIKDIRGLLYSIHESDGNNKCVTYPSTIDELDSVDGGFDAEYLDIHTCDNWFFTIEDEDVVEIYTTWNIDNLKELYHIATNYRRESDDSYEFHKDFLQIHKIYFDDKYRSGSLSFYHADEPDNIITYKFNVDLKRKRLAVDTVCRPEDNEYNEGALQ